VTSRRGRFGLPRAAPWAGAERNEPVPRRGLGFVAGGRLLPGEAVAWHLVSPTALAVLAIILQFCSKLSIRGSCWGFLRDEIGRKPRVILSLSLSVYIYTSTRKPKAARPLFRNSMVGITESHRITECSGLEGTSVGHPVQPPAEAGSPRAGCTGPRPCGFEYLQRRRLHNLPGQPVPGLRHPQSEEVLPHVQTDLPKLRFVPVAPCPVTGHHWKELGPILLTLTLEIFIRSPLSLLFSRLNKPSSLSLSS